jgi:hypothetical protein
VVARRSGSLRPSYHPLAYPLPYAPGRLWSLHTMIESPFIFQTIRRESIQGAAPFPNTKVYWWPAPPLTRRSASRKTAQDPMFTNTMVYRSAFSVIQFSLETNMSWSRAEGEGLRRARKWRMSGPKPTRQRDCRSRPVIFRTKSSHRRTAWGVQKDRRR